MSKLLYFLFLFCAIPCMMVAQSFQISGTVTDASDGSPLPGVTVQTQRNTGSVTDIYGKYTLQVEKGDVLSFSFLGMITQTVKVDNQQVINIELKEDNVALEEVVVVGYGTMKKSDLSGASVSLGEDKIKGSLITNIDQALQGRAAGVTSVMTSGAPGSAVSIRIRGQATINAGAEPLYVVDGVVFQGGGTTGNGFGLNLGNGASSSISPLSTLNPSDIVSMEILKDASATAIYGAQGSNGVVLITTKRGKAGKAKISYEGMYGVQDQYRRLDMMNLREYATFNNAVASTTGGTDGNPEYFDPALLGKGTNWQDAVFQTAPVMQHTVSASGGNETVQFYTSGSYMDQEGTIIGTDFNRYSVRVGLDAQLRSWLKLGINANYSRTQEHLNRAEGQEGILTYSLLTPPDIPIYDAYGDYASLVREGYTRVNPIAIAELDKNLLSRQKLNGNIFFDVTPVKNLVWHAELGYDISGSRSENWQPTYDFGPAVQRLINSISWQRNNSDYWQVKNYVTYNGRIDKHSFSAMLGQEASESSWEWQRISSKSLPSNVVKNPQLGATSAIADGFGDGSMVSFFTRETYNYDDRYLGTYTYRRDGSSNFGPKNRWANFHSLAGSWRFSNEAFFEPLEEVVSNGKLRLGWGQTGNSNIGGGLWNAALQKFPTALGDGYKQSQIANPLVKWETQEQWNIGLDLGFFHDRINLTIDAYEKTSKDMLMQLQLPTYFGSRGNESSALTAPMGNFGSIENKGLEISLNTHNLTGAFTWDTDFQISFNKNKLVALSGTDASGIEGYGQWSDVVALSEIGGPLYSFYGYIADGVYKDRADIEEHLWGEDNVQNGNFDRYQTVFVGDVKYRDISGPDGVPDGKITTDDRTTIGSPLPDFTFGFNNTFRYKNFDLTIFIQGSYGNKVFNALGRDLTGMGYWSNQLQKATDFANIIPIDPDKVYPANGVNNWFEDIDNVTLSNPDTKISRGGRGLPYNNTRISTNYIEDGSYLRIKNIVLGYTLPKQWLRKVQIENLRVSMNIQNLFTFTKYSGYDPEIGVNPQDAKGYTFGFDQGRYPSPRVISFGASLSF